MKLRNKFLLLKNVQDAEEWERTDAALAPVHIPSSQWNGKAMSVFTACLAVLRPSNHLDEPHEVLQFRSDVVCGRGTGLLRTLSQGDTRFLADPCGQHFSTALVSLVPQDARPPSIPARGQKCVSLSVAFNSQCLGWAPEAGGGQFLEAWGLQLPGWLTECKIVNTRLPIS